MGLLLHEIPLVDHYHQTLAVAVDYANDGQILGLNALGCVNDQEADVAVFDGAQGAHVAVELEVFVNLDFFAESGRVKQHELHSKLGKALVHGVAGGACDVGHDAYLFFKKGVGNR